MPIAIAVSITLFRTRARNNMARLAFSIGLAARHQIINLASAILTIEPFVTVFFQPFSRYFFKSHIDISNFLRILFRSIRPRCTVALCFIIHLYRFGWFASSHSSTFRSSWQPPMQTATPLRLSHRVHNCRLELIWWASRPLRASEHNSHRHPARSLMIHSHSLSSVRNIGLAFFID